MITSIGQMLIPWLINLASILITACVPIVMVWLSNHVALSKNVMLNQLISGAVARAAGIAMSPQVVINGSSGIQAGVQYVVSSFPDAIAALGITPEKITTMITGEMGKILAVKPAVLG